MGFCSDARSVRVTNNTQMECAVACRGERLAQHQSSRRDARVLVGLKATGIDKSEFMFMLGFHPNEGGQWARLEAPCAILEAPCAILCYSVVVRETKPESLCHCPESKLARDARLCCVGQLENPRCVQQAVHVCAWR